MRTIVYPPPGILGLGRSRTVGVVAHPLTLAETHRITVGLAEQGIRVRPAEDGDNVLHLWARHPMTTEQEVTAIRAYAAETDCRIAWHGAVR